MKRLSARVPSSFHIWSIRLPILLSALLTVTFSAADPFAPASQVIDPTETATELSAVAQLGRKMFFDPSLSSSGQQSCASCHSPTAGYGPPNDLAVQLGGPDLKRSGIRAVPSLRYLEHTPNFSIGPNPEMADNDPVPLDPAASSAAALPAN